MLPLTIGILANPSLMNLYFLSYTMWRDAIKSVKWLSVGDYYVFLTQVAASSISTSCFC